MQKSGYIYEPFEKPLKGSDKFGFSIMSWQQNNDFSHCCNILVHVTLENHFPRRTSHLHIRGGVNLQEPSLLVCDRQPAHQERRRRLTHTTNSTLNTSHTPPFWSAEGAETKTNKNDGPFLFLKKKEANIKSRFDTLCIWLNDSL